MTTILLVEDELSIREMLAFSLSESGFKTLEAENSQQAMAILETEKIDIILLDWMLPGISGIDFCKRLKKAGNSRSIPVIMLTAKATEEDKVLGFEAGVDDYVTKPFSSRELLARINAVLRRVQSEIKKDNVLEIGGLTLNEISHRVTSDNKSIELGPTEFKLLQFLMSHPDRVYSRGQLLDFVWGDNVYVEERTVDVHIRRLRKALEDTGHDKLVQTVRGSGYRFSEN